MRFLLLCLILCITIHSVVSQGKFSTCNSMHTTPKIARAACTASCIVQNCPSGNCVVSRGRKTCVCSRCGKGSNVGINIGVGKGKK
ncbi:hypothetical protein RB195_013492 [Necator americanus]